MKEVIFLSHKAPDDNYFAAWLASKLKLFGYKVWLEIDELKSGEAFWPEIEKAIREQAVKVLCIISQNYLKNILDPSSGIFKELSVADRIKDTKNLKVPIKIDDVNEDDFPLQLMGLNGIDFCGNWQEGLDTLLKSFKKENIPKNGSSDNMLTFWQEAFDIKSIVNNDQEKIYTNWFKFGLPKFLYVHQPKFINQLDMLDFQLQHPYIEYGDRHISFFPENSYPSSTKLTSSTVFEIDQILEVQDLIINESFTINEPRKKVIELVNKLMSIHLNLSSLNRYSQSNREIFYYRSTEENRKRVSLKSIGKTNVSVTGKVKKKKWSFAISSTAALYPFPHLRIGSHIIFTSENNVILDIDEQHTLRRKFGFDWYNRDWLDTLLGMMLKIAGSEGTTIKIPIGGEKFLYIDAIPISCNSDFGYQEPIKEAVEND